jgi:replicative DNA helicase
MVHEYLLSSILRDDDVEVLNRVKDKHLPDPLKPVFTYVRQVLVKNKALPTKQAVEAKFNTSFSETQDPAKHWFDEVLETYKQDVSEAAIRDMARNPKQSMQVMQRALMEMQAEEELRSHPYDHNAVDRIGEYTKNAKNKGIKYLPTGDAHFDSHTFGYTQADFWMIGGEEGSGKTWLLLQLLMQADTESRTLGWDRPILIINTEVDDDEFLERMDAIRFKLPYGKLLSGTLDAVEMKRWATGARKLKSNIIVINDCYNLNDLQKLLTLLKPAAVFVDSVHLLAEDYDWKDIANLGTALKKMAKRSMCPIIATTHLKTGAGKDAATGSVDSFAYGKGFTRNATVALLIYRDEQMEMQDEIGIKFVKLRRGQAKAAHWIYSTDFTKMRYEHKYDNGIGASKVVVTDDDDDDDPNQTMVW